MLRGIHTMFYIYMCMYTLQIRNYKCVYDFDKIMYGCLDGRPQCGRTIFFGEGDRRAARQHFANPSKHPRWQSLCVKIPAVYASTLMRRIHVYLHIMLHVLVIKSLSQCFAACNTQFLARRQRSPNASSLYVYLPDCHAVAQDHSPFTAYTNCTEYMCKLHETLALIPIFCMENLKKHLAALFAWPIARAKAIQVLPCSLAVLSPFAFALCCEITLGLLQQRSVESSCVWKQNALITSAR